MWLHSLSVLTQEELSPVSRHCRDRLSGTCAVLLALAALVACRAPSGAPLPTATQPPPTRPSDPTPPPAASFDGAPLADFSTAGFAGARQCSLCHNGLVDQDGVDVSIDTHWRSTMMANAAKDPLWQAKVSSEVARNPVVREVIESKCATCHMPMAWTQANADGEATSILDSGYLDPAHPLHAAAMDGVSCTLCHQIQNVGLGEQASFSGYYTIDTAAVPPERSIYGPYPDPLAPQMQMHVGYTPVEGPHVREAGLCATCHTLYTPYVDAQGNVAGEFPEQMAYLEWKHSSFGGHASCQRCHMPAAKGSVIISTMPRGRMVQPREPFSQHHFVGGNAFMMDVFQRFGPELGLTAGKTHLDETLARTISRLGTGSARLEIDQAQVADGQLMVVLDVSSMAGHKLPTGFPSRRAWIHLTVTGADSKALFESGRPEADGSIAGSDADADAAMYEPHYDLITDPDQVQIYESVMQDTEGQVTYTLLRGASYVKDNRLLPSGFEVATADEDIALRGGAAQDENFRGGGDRITYQVDLGGASGPYQISANLLYQAVSYRFTVDLCRDEGTLVERWCRYYEDADRTPTVVASAEGRAP